MTLNALQVEAITQSVLQELRSRGVSVAQGRPPLMTPASTSPPIVPKAIEVSDSVQLMDKVVTEDSLNAANAAGRTITIPAGAIVTPSGRDFIRRNGITIASNTKTTTVTRGKVIIVGDCSAAVSAASAAGWEAVKAGCERDAASKTRKNTGSPIVCCGGEAAITACLLNRNENFRAAVVSSNTNVQKLMATMHPNVLCLESAWAFAALLKLFRSFGFEAAAPAGWKELSR